MRSLALFTIGVLVACGDGGGGDDIDDTCPATVGSWCVEPAVRACYDATPAITQGVYGCVAEQPDVGDPLPPAYAVVNYQLDLYADSTMTTPIAGTRTSSTGFYEIPMAAGQVYFCKDLISGCQPFTIPTGTIAVDMTISVITTWSER